MNQVPVAPNQLFCLLQSCEHFLCQPSQLKQQKPDQWLKCCKQTERTRSRELAMMGKAVCLGQEARNLRHRVWG